MAWQSINLLDVSIHAKMGKTWWTDLKGSFTLSWYISMCWAKGSRKTTTVVTTVLCISFCNLSNSPRSTRQSTPRYIIFGFFRPCVLTLTSYIFPKDEISLNKKKAIIPISSYYHLWLQAKYQKNHKSQRLG